MGRDKESMISFIKERKWESLEVISSWKAPNSIQMSTLAHFFKLSEKVRVSIKMLLIYNYITDNVARWIVPKIPKTKLIISWNL